MSSSAPIVPSVTPHADRPDATGAGPHLARALETTSFAIVEIDASGHVVWANPAAERMLGLTRDVIAARHVADAAWLLQDVDGAPVAPDAIPAARALRGETVTGFVHAIVHPVTGARVILEVDATPLRDASGAVIGAVASCVDVTARVEHERTLREVQRIARVGSWRWDVGTGVLAWDEGICALYGIAPDEAPRDFDGYLARVHPDDRDRAREVAGGAFATGEPFAFDHRVVWPDGTVRVLHGRGTVRRAPDGSVAAMLGSSQDITERVAVERELARLLDSERHARADAEEANRAKAQFLATMSHELRTPLNAIQGHVQLLEMGVHGPVTDAQREALDRVARAQRHLLGLIEGVLGFAKLEAGRVRFDLAPALVADVLADVLALVEPQRLARGLALAAHLPEDAGAPPVPVLVDREKLAQVLLNLLGNAIKFTPPGGRIDVTLDATDARTAALRIADTGVGIPADRLEAIFEPFVQVDATLTRENGGTGLGLAISRELVRGMGGDLTAESVPGEGSTFTVTLPRA